MVTFMPLPYLYVGFSAITLAMNHALKAFIPCFSYIACFSFGIRALHNRTNLLVAYSVVFIKNSRPIRK